jgi:hypothetical protein
MGFRGSYNKSGCGGPHWPRPTLANGLNLSSLPPAPPRCDFVTAGFEVFSGPTPHDEQVFSNPHLALRLLLPLVDHAVAFAGAVDPTAPTSATRSREMAAGTSVRAVTEAFRKHSTVTTPTSSASLVQSRPAWSSARRQSALQKRCPLPPARRGSNGAEHHKHPLMTCPAIFRSRASAEDCTGSTIRSTSREMCFSGLQHVGNWGQRTARA